MKLFRYYNEEVGKRENGWFVGVVIGCCFVSGLHYPCHVNRCLHGAPSNGGNVVVSS